MVLLPMLLDPRNYAFFFDFDGTLTELAVTPEAVVVEDRARKALGTLFDATGGAVAIVTGREIESIDLFFHPLRFPVAGVHGFERRNGHGLVSGQSSEDSAARSVDKILRAFVSHNPGLLLERKRGALALHYRLRPELEALCISLAEDVAARLPEAVLTRGKMVIETRLHRATKGTAIQDFLKEPPFRGRVPFFAGDDVTDEDGFAAVNELGGISIKVGTGTTAAKNRAATVDEFLSWLGVTAEKLTGLQTHG
jgi:trehalose 6-phosphate phosphatase